MANFYRWITCIFAVFYVAQASASIPVQDVKECLPLSKISSVKFDEAILSDGVWVIAKNLYYKSRNWEVIFTFPWEEIKSSKKALKWGQELYNTKVMLSAPKIEPKFGSCMYASYHSYVVWAELRE